MRKTLKLFTSLAVSAALVLSVCGLYVNLTTPDKLRICPDDTPYVNTGSLYTSVVVSDESVSADTGKSIYRADLKLFGLIPVKSITVERIQEKSVSLSGRPFGIKLHTNGVVVVGTEKIKTSGGELCPCAVAGIEEGDAITEVNGIEIKSCTSLSEMINGSKGKAIRIKFRKPDGEVKERAITPVYCESDNCYKAGAWVRDSAAGIGTMTYIDNEKNIFAGLGHGICDVDTGKLMPLGNGDAVGVTITGVTKGADGLPGELHGYFGDTVFGTLSRNSQCGVFGTLRQQYGGGDEYTVAMKQDAKEGKAHILTTIPGSSKPELYDAVIERINYDDDAPTKNMVIKVVDKKLLSATGGIVQGMSGSPIIQNGKFVAAVTHVFVNDSSKGYAIFAENMIYVENE